MFSIITDLKFFPVDPSRFATLGGMQLHAGKARFPGIVSSFQFDAKSWHQLLQLASSCTVGRVFMLAPHAFNVDRFDLPLEGNWVKYDTTL